MTIPARTPSLLELSFPDDPASPPVRIAPGERLVVGRAAECGVSLDNQSVSREHAVLDYGGDGLTVQDRASKHGTRVNGVRLIAGIPALAGEGDVIQFGPVRMRVERVYARLRTDMSATGADQVRTVFLEERKGAPQLVRTLRELMRVQAAEGGREEMAQALLRQVIGATSLERALLVRGGDARDDARVRIVAQVGADIGAISRTVLHAARDPLHVAHLSQHQQIRMAESIIGSGVTEMVCARVPVRSGEELFLYCDSRHKAGLVGDEIAQFIGVAAAVCGLVFDSIEYRKLGEMRSHFERAATVQRNLLPQRTGEAGSVGWALESIPAAPPAEASMGASVSGDIVGVAARPDGSTLVWIGDVCGHGIGAALLMSAAQSWLHAAAGRVEDPAVTLAALNEFLYQHTEPFDFASLLVAAVAADGAVEICDAGHGHAFRVRADGAEYVEFPAESGGFVVGAMPDSRYASVRMRLESGERLVLVTDGVRETKSPASEEFGVARVLEALRGASGAEQDVARMLDSVHRFSDGVREDDLTILSIARR